MATTTHSRAVAEPAIVLAGAARSMGERHYAACTAAHPISDGDLWKM